MKKIAALIVMTVICMGMNMHAIDINRVEKIKPTDEIFMDMAVSAAKKSISSKTGASGAVIILNGAWRATGTPEGDKTAEEVAFSKARLSNLTNAVVYTLNEPTTATINFLNSLGVTAIYFVNGRDAVVAAGIYPASAYDDEVLDTSVTMAPVYCIPFPDGSALLK